VKDNQKINELKRKERENRELKNSYLIVAENENSDSEEIKFINKEVEEAKEAFEKAKKELQESQRVFNRKRAIKALLLEQYIPEELHTPPELISEEVKGECKKCKEKREARNG